MEKSPIGGYSHLIFTGMEPEENTCSMHNVWLVIHDSNR